MSTSIFEGLVRNKAVHIALGVRVNGAKELLGLWVERNEGAKFWMPVMNELKNRSVEDVLLAVIYAAPGGSSPRSLSRW